MSCHTCVIANDASSPPAISAIANYDDAAHAKAVHEGRGERTEQSEQHDADRQRRGNLRVVPAEFFLKRHDQHAGHAHGRGGDKQGEESHSDHDPSIMNVAAGKCRGERSAGGHATPPFVTYMTIIIITCTFMTIVI